MNFTDLETVWRSPHNRPSAAELEKTKMQFVVELRRRRRGNLRFLVATALPLVVFTVLVVRHLLAPQPGDDPIDFSREWAIIPLYLLPWAAWIYIVRMHFRHCAEHRHFDRSINASVVALLDENRSERSRCKFVGTMLLVTVPLLALIVHQLRTVGKAGDEILLPGFVFAPALLLGIALGMLIHYRRKLLPRKHELESLLENYNATDRIPSAG